MYRLLDNYGRCETFDNTVDLLIRIYGYNPYSEYRVTIVNRGTFEQKKIRLAHTWFGTVHLLLDDDDNDLMLDEIPTTDYFRTIKLRQHNYYGTYTFRCGPVKRTGKRGYGRYYRRVHTHQENTWTNAHLEDEDIRFYNVHIRCARNKLPTAWDDISRHNERKSWKRYRKNQWKD